MYAIIFVGPQLWKWNGENLENKENLWSSNDDFILTEDYLKPLEERPKASLGDTYVYIKNMSSRKVLVVDGNGKNVVEKSWSNVGEFEYLAIAKNNCVDFFTLEGRFTSILRSQGAVHKLCCSPKLSSSGLAP